MLLTVAGHMKIFMLLMSHMMCLECLSLRRDIGMSCWEILLRQQRLRATVSERIHGGRWFLR